MSYNQVALTSDKTLYTFVSNKTKQSSIEDILEYMFTLNTSQNKGNETSNFA